MNDLICAKIEQETKDYNSCTMVDPKSEPQTRFLYSVEKEIIYKLKIDLKKNELPATYTDDIEFPLSVPRCRQIKQTRKQEEKDSKIKQKSL
jgi:hypothetical protein